MADEPQAPEQGIKTFSACVPAPILPVKKLRKLRLSQEAFVRAIADPSKPSFCNGAQAHMVSHPSTKSRAGAAVSASHSLRKANVQEAIVRAFEAVKYDKEGLSAELSKNLQACWDAKRLDLHQSAIERYAKLTGEWKERSEVENVDSAQANLIRKLVVERVVTDRQVN